jgi:hypothetical protein
MGRLASLQKKEMFLNGMKGLTCFVNWENGKTAKTQK